MHTLLLLLALATGTALPCGPSVVASPTSLQYGNCGWLQNYCPNQTRVYGGSGVCGWNVVLPAGLYNFTIEALNGNTVLHQMYFMSSPCENCTAYYTNQWVGEPFPFGATHQWGISSTTGKLGYLRTSATQEYQYVSGPPFSFYMDFTNQDHLWVQLSNWDLTKPLWNVSWVRLLPCPTGSYMLPGGQCSICTSCNAGEHPL